ncbi:hypothetical protein [Vibrio diazotrophicus]|uniref:hypothetical protein n=1 Tax=Vibrio diazotrophicus TaxID=685 RepID=UPI0011AF53F8|nr:hypothetical protein [Vibrio diazotrophicus]
MIHVETHSVSQASGQDVEHVICLRRPFAHGLTMRANPDKRFLDGSAQYCIGHVCTLRIEVRAHETAINPRAGLNISFRAGR